MGELRDTLEGFFFVVSRVLVKIYGGLGEVQEKSVHSRGGTLSVYSCQFQTSYP